jgi:hypothetical protein
MRLNIAGLIITLILSEREGQVHDQGTP